MRVFIAGGAGVLGRAVIPLLIAAGHEVSATTRSESKAPLLEQLGAFPVVVDALDRQSLTSAVVDAEPQAILHLMTDLAAGDSASNARLRSVGTRNLVSAAQHAGVDRMIAESISWIYPSGATPATESDPLDREAAEPKRTTIRAVDDLESAVRELPDGIVLRLGQLYGPGTWYSRDGRFGVDARAGRLTATETVVSFIHTSDAARALSLALEWESGTWNIVDDEPASGLDWLPHFATAVGAPEPVASRSGDIGRPVSNDRSRASGLVLDHPSWRAGFSTL